MPPPLHPSALRRARLRHLARALVLLCLGSLALTVTGDSAARTTWPGNVIRFYNPTGYQRTLDVAALKWNQTGVNIRLVKVATARDADVIVRADSGYLQRTCGGECIGYSTQIGYQPNTHGPAGLILPSYDEGTQDVPDALHVAVAAHELGHLIGLQHRNGCSLMDPVVTTASCHAKELTVGDDLRWALGGPIDDDITQALALYGGKRNPGYDPRFDEHVYTRP